MGCTPSKQSVCRNCHARCSPVRRSYSSHAQGENHHVVALTSTTLGYLLLDPTVAQDPVPEKNNKDFAVGIIEARTWSKMIDEKISKIVPKTPIRTPPGEPETINAWELMEGLDDTSPPSAVDHLRCFSFNINSNSILDEPPLLLVSQEKDPDVELLCKPQLADNHSDWDSNSNDFHQNSIAPFIKSFQVPDPYHPKPMMEQSSDAKISVQNEIMPHGKEKLVLYFTSLRGVRKTYEDCCYVRVILKSSSVRVDERDVSMHSGFKEELKELLGDGYGLPKVFLGKKYIGGADEIRRLHDEFQLDKVLEGCEMVDDIGGGPGGCDGCGDIRFLPCETCSGSCKIYNEVNSDEDVKEDEDDYGFQRCPDCNENGLVRCPICCH